MPAGRCQMPCIENFVGDISDIRVTHFCSEKFFDIYKRLRMSQLSISVLYF